MSENLSIQEQIIDLRVTVERIKEDAGRSEKGRLYSIVSTKLQEAELFAEAAGKETE